MATDLIRYDLLIQDAMRGVMRRVLADVADSGALPGDHHFTISFRTAAPGVLISKRLAEQWPQEMTIILHYQYSNLFVDDDGFGVTLSFRSILEKLYVPFEAVTGFFDPSVEFGLRFEPMEEGEDGEEEAPAPRPGPSLVRAEPAAQSAPAKLASVKGEKVKDLEAPSAGATAGDVKSATQKSAAQKNVAPKSGGKGAEKSGEKGAEKSAGGKAAEGGKPAEESGEAKVVSIDAFRKKT
jgi:hypothetical protein